MRAYARIALAGVMRAPGRTATRVIVLAASVALLGGMLLFVGNSLRTVASGAVRSVPLDLQGPVTSYAKAKSVAAGIARQPGVLQSSATATTPLARATHHGPAGTTSTGSGGILAVPPGYLRNIHTFRMLHGGLARDGIVLDQQMAATLRARLGDSVQVVTRAGAKPVPLTVTGVAIVTAPDALFQPLNPSTGPAPAQPPANIAVVPVDTFAQKIAPTVRTITPASVGSSAQPGAQDGTQWQVQVQLDPGPLGSSTPTNGFARATHEVNRLERSLPGQVQFVDNLSDALATAADDALYAQTLYIMLAVPGALIALGLAYLAALGTVQRDRRDLALLRARGSTRRDLLKLAVVESLLVGAVAGLAGAGLALAAVELLVKGGAQLTPVRTLVTVVVCVAVAVAGAAVARVGATLSALRGTVAEGRKATRRERRPLWQRLWIDVACLAVSGLIYWLTAKTGFSAVVNPDSNPTLSLSVYMFFAPALLWLGATLLLVRLRGRFVGRLALGAAGKRASTTRGFLLASAGRRGGAINRGLIVVGLLLAFGVNVGIFSATYRQQANVDAQLTLGADVTATVAPGVAQKQHLEARVAAVPGVKATTAVDHSYAYVGPDLQDTYGIDTASFTRATSLRDSYFLDGTVDQELARLRSTRDGILVGKETITDYSLHRGDLLRLRVLDRQTGRFHVVPFHVVGIVQEFPSAPKDSFMVANQSYLAEASHSGGPNVVFARTGGDPGAVARRVADATRSAGAEVHDIEEQTAKTTSSITTVDLTGISRIEEAFAIALATAAMALFVALAIAERRRELATMAAVGAPLRLVGAFLWSEAALVLAAGLALAAGLGWLLSQMLVAMLQHVFDPPPDALAIPWAYLGGLAGAATVATLLATWLAARGLRRLPLGAILREQ